MSEILPGICRLALDVGDVCGQVELRYRRRESNKERVL